MTLFSVFHFACLKRSPDSPLIILLLLCIYRVSIYIVYIILIGHGLQMVSAGHQPTPSLSAVPPSNSFIHPPPPTDIGQRLVLLGLYFVCQVITTRNCKEIM